MIKIKNLIESHWGKNKLYLSIFLYPLSIIFYLLLKIRLFLYHIGILKTHNFNIPIIIIGNLHIGGTGKTPIIIEISKRIALKNIKLGIISRGYGRENNKTLLVNPNGNANDYGDEPLLIAQKTNLPVVVSNNKANAINFLLKNFPNLNIIISDDGLQHYAINRNLEIITFPYDDIEKKLMLIPEGPLREPINRIKKDNFIIFTNYNKDKNLSLIKNFSFLLEKNIYFSKLEINHIYQLANPERIVQIEYFYNKDITILCAIANHHRFINTLENNKINITNKFIYPDHYPLTNNEIPKKYDNILITEKDAVKLKSYNLPNVWVVVTKITIEPNIINNILSTLKVI